MILHVRNFHKRSYADNADAPFFRGVTENDVTMAEKQNNKKQKTLLWFSGAITPSFDKTAFFEMSKVEHNLNASLMRRAI
ncbi:Protein of unknown function [Cotesia congregata]|uniref:Uncharacterized protein n=1 Tax=Cotesia congregata TaxID=51543 RepID=A0A8J2MPE7_COTCN|nr:Protein of unknown function [Cotesia congregata]